MNINKLIENIIEIYDCNNNVLNYKKIAYDKIVAKYSSTKQAVFRLIIDGVVINRKCSYIVIYKCILCNMPCKTNINNLNRKINNNITFCRICKEESNIKQNKQSEMMKNNNPNCHSYQEKIVNTKKKLKYDDLILNSNDEFAKMDTIFKESYFKKHLTNDEYNKIKPYIISFQSEKLLDIDNYVYLPHIKCNNYAKFIPMIYHKTTHKIEKLNYIKFKCMNCDKPFTNKNMYIQKGKIKIYCKECNFCNNIFKLRTYINVNGNELKYQSTLELKFIKFCNQHNILVINGPSLPYKWNNKDRIYKVDFYLPELNYLIEMKDDHIWHRKQVESGKWAQKENAANKCVNLGQYSKYLLIFPNNYDQLTNFILNKI